MSSNTINDTTNNEEVVTNPKPRFPTLKRFMGNEYEDMRLQLNELVIGTNVAYQYYTIEDKSTCPWKKLCNSLCSINGLFSGYEQPSNQSPLCNMKVKLFRNLESLIQARSSAHLS